MALSRHNPRNDAAGQGRDVNLKIAAAKAISDFH